MSSNLNETNTSSIPPFISNLPPSPPNELDNNENEYDNDIPKELNLSNELNRTETEDNEEKNNEDDDDEWADFVDSSLKPPEPDSSSSNQQQQQQQQIPMQTNGAFNVSDACKLDNVSSNLETSPTKLDEAAPKTDVLSSMFNHNQEESSQILSRLFGSLSFFNSKSVPKESSVININPLDVNSDKTWNQLKEFTFINDASPSLKFKWVLSELETNFLNSINIDNTILKNQNKPYYVSFSNGGILQPVKSEETTSTSTSKAANTDNNNLDLLSSSNHSNKSSNEPSTTTSTNSKSATPVLDIDLSYFEDQSKTTTNQSTANKPNIQKNPRAYINELLDDIYVNNNQKAVTNTNKKSEFPLMPENLQKQQSINGFFRANNLFQNSYSYSYSYSKHSKSSVFVVKNDD